LLCTSHACVRVCLSSSYHQPLAASYQLSIAAAASRRPIASAARIGNPAGDDIKLAASSGDSLSRRAMNYGARSGGSSAQPGPHSNRRNNWKAAKSLHCQCGKQGTTPVQHDGPHLPAAQGQALRIWPWGRKGKPPVLAAHEPRESRPMSRPRGRPGPQCTGPQHPSPVSAHCRMSTSSRWSATTTRTSAACQRRSAC
jgi:hypothetical protein